MKTVEVSVKDINDNDVTIEYDCPESLEEALEYLSEGLTEDAEGSPEAKAVEKILGQYERMTTTDVRNGARSKLKAGMAVDEVLKLYKPYKPGGTGIRARGDATKMLVGRAAKMDTADVAKLIEQLQAQLAAKQSA